MNIVAVGKQLYNEGRSRIGYDNLLEQGTVVASSAEVQYPVENAFDWRTDDFFRPASAGTVTITLTLPKARHASYFAYFQQDLFKKGGSLRLQRLDGASWVNVGDGIAPADNAPRMLFFDPVPAKQWRVVLTCDEAFSIGVLAFGEALLLPYGMYLNWTPPVLARATRTLSSVSESGAFLGRSVIGQGVKTDLILQGTTDQWVRDHWQPFVEHAERKPFFFTPDALQRPDDCMFAWVEDDLTPPRHSNYGYMGTALRLRGMVE
ncbi:hypothetical protein [Methylopila sp. 73B]|uniref:hypothetical protein n=1 Tax=Methylopila sp. 73B TaxID=1120792 RepID=UPI00038052E1|nr:hypothetical protein [Methylopila sp. 73B]